MSRRYLITGAQGLIGRYLTAALLGREPDATIIGIGRSPKLDRCFTHTISTAQGPIRAPLPPELRSPHPTPPRNHLRADTRDEQHRERPAGAGRFHYDALPLSDAAGLRALLRELRPHCTFHLASALHTAPERALFETNVEGTLSLLRAVGEVQGAQGRVVLGSSGSVYGAPSRLPLREDDACLPAELYGLSKLTAEHLGRVEAGRFGFACVTARIFNVVGPGQNEDHVCARFAAQVAMLEGRAHPRIEVGPLEPTRDFIDVRDVAAGLIVLADRGERGGIYNLASGRETAIGEVLDGLLEAAGLKGRVAIVRAAQRPGGVLRHVAELSRLRALGFEPAHTLRQSLCDLLRYHRGLYGTGATPPQAHP